MAEKGGQVAEDAGKGEGEDDPGLEPVGSAQGPMPGCFFHVHLWD